MSRLRAIFNFGWIAAPKAIGGACLIVLNILLISRMSRDEFAIYSLCFAMLTLLSEGVFGAAVDMAVLKLSPLHLEHQPHLSLGIERTALRMKVLVIGCLSVVLIVGSVPLGKFLFHQAGYAHLIGVVAVAACFSVALASLLVHLQVRGKFLQYGLLDWMQMLAKYAGIAAVLWSSALSNSTVPPAGVLIWFAAAPAASIIFYSYISGVHLFRPDADSVRWRGELIRQANWMLATLVVSMLISKLDLFLLTCLSTIDEVGLYSGGQTLAAVPLMFGTYLAIVLNPKVMPFCKSGRFFPLLRDVQLALLLFGIFAYSVIYFYRDTIATRLLPGDFADSRDIFLVLLPMSLAGMMSYPLTISFLMYFRPRILIQMECALLLPTLIAYWIAISHYGAMGTAVVTATMGIIKTIIAQWAAFKWARKTPAELGLSDVTDAVSVD